MKRPAPQLVRVLVTRAFCLGDGRGDVYPDDVVELELNRARSKQAEGYVEILDDSEPKHSARAAAKAAGAKEGNNK